MLKQPSEWGLLGTDVGVGALGTSEVHLFAVPPHEQSNQGLREARDRGQPLRAPQRPAPQTHCR